MKVDAAAIVVAFALVGGCSGDGALPTSPITPTPGPTAPAPISPIDGQITIVAMEPQSGTTVAVFDCDPSIPPNFSTVKARPKHFAGPCANGFRAAVDVELAEDLSDARIILEFRDGTGNRCAYADSYVTSLQAHARQNVVFGELMLTENAPNAPLSFCALPVTTTEAVVSVFSGNGNAQPVLSTHIPHTYTFVSP